MIGNKILLFGGQDNLQTITTIDMYLLNYLVLIQKVIPFGILVNLYLFQLILRLSILINLKIKEFTCSLITMFLLNITATTYRYIFPRKMRKNKNIKRYKKTFQW